MNATNTQYTGSDRSSYLQHYGRSARDGAPVGSGRYRLGSGENPRAAIAAGLVPKTKRVAKAAFKGAKRSVGTANRAVMSAYKKHQKQASVKKAQKAEAKRIRQELKDKEALAKKLEAEEAKKEKEAANREKNMRNPLWIKRHMDEMTLEELNTARTRIEAENNLRKAALSKANSGKEYIDLVVGYGKSFMNGYDLIDDIISKGEKKSKPKKQYSQQLAEEFAKEARKSSKTDEEWDKKLKEIHRHQQLESAISGKSNKGDDSKGKSPTITGSKTHDGDGDGRISGRKRNKGTK